MQKEYEYVIAIYDDQSPITDVALNTSWWDKKASEEKYKNVIINKGKHTQENLRKMIREKIQYILKTEQ